MPGEKIGHGRLPASTRAHDREDFPTLDPEVQPFQNRPAPFERERHVLEGQIAANGGQTGRLVPLADFRFGVEDLVHPAERHFGRCEVGPQCHQPLDRREEPHLVRHKSDERAESYRPVDDTGAPIQKHDGGAPRKNHPRETTGQVREPAHRHERVDERVVSLAETTDLTLLRVGRDDQLHSMNRLYQKRADVGAALAKFRHARFQLSPIVHQRPQCRRNHDQADREQLWVQQE